MYILTSQKPLKLCFFKHLSTLFVICFQKDNNQEINNITVSITFHISGWFFLHFFFMCIDNFSHHKKTVAINA